jgi:hypothetical protein
MISSAPSRARAGTRPARPPLAHVHMGGVLHPLLGQVQEDENGSLQSAVADIVARRLRVVRRAASLYIHDR